MIILFVPKTAMFVVHICWKQRTYERKPDFISAVASSEKEKYAFRKTKLYRKLRVDVNIISNSRRYERKRYSPIKRVQKTPSKKRRRAFEKDVPTAFLTWQIKRL